MEEFHGNNGTPCSSGDYSAPRYTEARLTGLALQIFQYLNDGVLSDKDWAPTYDEEGKFPLVLPSLGFYGVCNGSFGSIGVGLISSIPQFNLREMNAALIELINNPKAEIDLLPDFASGGILLNPQTVKRSLADGEGKSALLRGVVEKHPKEGYLEVTELPYGVYTNTVCVELEKAKEANKAPFKDFKDLSKKSVRLRIYSDKLDECEKWLYKNTSVQKFFTIKLIMLRGGKMPKKFTLKEAMLEHIAHAKGVLRRHYEHELQVLKNRAEIINGFIKLQSILDEVIAAIRAVDGNKAAVIVMLRQKFEFTELQATAIADRRLHQLSKFDIMALEGELEENIESQHGIEGILGDESTFNGKLSVIYQQVADTYGDARHTKISDTDEWESSASGKIEKDAYCYLSAKGYIAAYSRDDEDLGGIDDGNIGYRRVSETLCIVTSQLRAFARNMGELPIGKNKWEDVLPIKDGEHVISVMSKSEFDALSRVVLEMDDGTERSLHPSFITTAASKRGKRILSGKTGASSLSVVE